jgi:hypothetical protein
MKLNVSGIGKRNKRENLVESVLETSNDGGCGTIRAQNRQLTNSLNYRQVSPTLLPSIISLES